MLGVNRGAGYGISCFQVKVRSDIGKFTSSASAIANFLHLLYKPIKLDAVTDK